jgi:hypothetical protein
MTVNRMIQTVTVRMCVELDATSCVLWSQFPSDYFALHHGQHRKIAAALQSSETTPRYHYTRPTGNLLSHSTHLSKVLKQLGHTSSQA